MSSHHASFGITNAKQFLEKLHEEQRDFVDSHCLSARHALNAILTAYHLHEWVWGEWLQKQDSLRTAWGVSCAEDFRDHLIKQNPVFDDARKVTNGTKHFAKKIKTGHHRGAFQRPGFQRSAFDVSFLWIDRDGNEQRAEDFIDELVKLWDGFFKQHKIG